MSDKAQQIVFLAEILYCIAVVLMAFVAYKITKSKP